MNLAYFKDVNVVLLFVLTASVLTSVLSYSFYSSHMFLPHPNQQLIQVVVAQGDGAQHSKPAAEDVNQQVTENPDDSNGASDEVAEADEEEQRLVDDDNKEAPLSTEREIEDAIIPKPDYPSDCPPGSYFNVDSSRGKECLPCIPDVDPHPACTGSASPLTQPIEEDGQVGQSVDNPALHRGDPIPDVDVPSTTTNNGSSE